VLSGRARLRKGSGLLARLIIARAKPVVAAVQGNCYGAGLSLAAASDYMVAEPGTKFCAAFVRLGLASFPMSACSGACRGGSGMDGRRS